MYEENQKPKSPIKIITIAGSVLLIIVALFVQLFTYENIDAGNVGIKINLYGTDRVYDQLTSAITPPPSLREMINAKNASIQARLKADNEAVQAFSEAKVKVAKAQGDADALIIKARGEAEANRLRQQSLTALLIQEKWIQKWDGQLPGTMAGNQPLMLMK